MREKDVRAAECKSEIPMGEGGAPSSGAEKIEGSGVGEGSDFCEGPQGARKESAAAETIAEGYGAEENGRKKRTVSGEIDGERWGESLRRAIMVTAANDYRAAKAALDRDPSDVHARRVQKSCEKFFLSDLYRSLTSIDGGYVLRKLKNEPVDRSFDRCSMRVLERYHFATEEDRARLFFDETVSPMADEIERELRSGAPCRDVAARCGISATNWAALIKHVPKFKEMVSSAQEEGARARREKREKEGEKIEECRSEMERRKGYIKKRFSEGASAKEVGDEFHVRASTVLKFAKECGIVVSVRRKEDGKKILAGKEDAVKALLDAGASHDELCKAFGVSSGTLSAFISKHNLAAERPSRSVLDGKEDYIRSALSDNKTLGEIAALFHVSEKTLSRYIRKNVAKFALPRQSAPETGK